MVSAVDIDGLNKLEQMEHLFNDVKYATLSLDKDIKQITEKFSEDILNIDSVAIKKRLQEEYSKFMKPTYEFLQLDGFSFSYQNLKEYIQKNQELFSKAFIALKRIGEIQEKLSMFGLERNWSYRSLQELVIVFQNIDTDVVPTKYWFDVTKYDFMQELINETQTKVDEFMTASRKLKHSWSEEVLSAENVAYLDYYMERKDAGLKLFDLTFHKAKKVLKDLFIDEYRSFQDSEIEELHANVYSIRRNEYWLSKNRNRIRNFWGENYDGENTDFSLLRTQYAVAYKLSSENTTDESRPLFIKNVLEENAFANMTQTMYELKGLLPQLPYDDFCSAFPAQREYVDELDLLYIAKTISCFITESHDLTKDYEEIISYTHLEQKDKDLTLEDLRIIVGSLEKIAQKKEWLKKYQLKIREVFRYEEINLNTDWNALKEKLFYTKLEEHFPRYEELQTLKQAINPEEMNYKMILEEILEVEAPIREDLLLKRVVSLLQLPRLTSKIKQGVLNALSEDLKETYEMKDGFAYKINQSDYELRIPMEDQPRREIETIAPVEVKNGIVTILRNKYEMTLDEISKQMAELLKYPRRTKKFSDTIGNYVKELQRECQIKRYSRGFRIEKC